MRLPKKRFLEKLLAAALLISIAGQVSCAQARPAVISLDKSYFYGTTCEKVMGDEAFFANFSVGESGKDEGAPSMVCANTPGGLLFAWQNGSDLSLLNTDESLSKTGSTQIALDPSALVSGLYPAPVQTYLLIKDRADSWDSGYTWYPADKGASGDAAEAVTVPAKKLTGLAVLDIETDPAGNCYVLTTEKLLSYDAKLNCRFEADIKDVYPVAVAASNETVYILGEKEDLSFCILSFDTRDGSAGKSIDLSGANDLAGADLFVREDGSLLIDGTLEIYGLDIAGGTFHALYGYSGNTIRKPSDIRFARMLADGSLVIRAMSPEDGGAGGEYRIRIGDTCVKKQEITVAAITDEPSSVLDLAVNAFNNSGSAYYVTVQTLGDTVTAASGDYDRLKKEFVTKALSGEAADVLLLDPGMLEDLSSSDALYNLEENDVFTKAVSGESLTPNIWAAGKEDGSRYWVTPFYNLEGLLVSTDVVESDRALDMDSFEQICGQYPKAAVMDSDSLGDLCTLYYPYIIDYCLSHAGNPDASFFESLLTQIQGNDRAAESSDSHYEKIQKREVLFDPMRMNSFTTFAGRTAFFDDKASFVTYPGVEGTITAEEYYAVSASSDQKDGACEFIAYLLSEGFESQAAAAGASGIPINENALRTSLAAGEKAVADKTAITIIANEQAPDIPHDMDRLEERFLSIVYSADKYLVRNEEITAILKEELAYLSAGDKDAAETAQVLGSRIWKVG